MGFLGGHLETGHQWNTSGVHRWPVLGYPEVGFVARLRGSTNETGDYRTGAVPACATALVHLGRYAVEWKNPAETIFQD